jgi:hypothetical protein
LTTTSNFGLMKENLIKKSIVEITIKRK